MLIYKLWNILKNVFLTHGKFHCSLYVMINCESNNTLPPVVKNYRFGKLGRRKELEKNKEDNKNRRSHAEDQPPLSFHPLHENRRKIENRIRERHQITNEVGNLKKWKIWGINWGECPKGLISAEVVLNIPRDAAPGVWSYLDKYGHIQKSQTLGCE